MFFIPLYHVHYAPVVLPRFEIIMLILAAYMLVYRSLLCSEGSIHFDLRFTFFMPLK